MKINNINGTSDNSCRCGNWLEHWKKFGGKTLPATCREVRCNEKPEVGAHVQKDSLSDKSWYIVPLCQRHNQEKGKSLEIVDTVLVSANVANTCGK